MKQYVICLRINNILYFFESERSGVIYKDGTRREPEGTFSPCFKDAIIYNDRWWAECISAGYEGSQVKSLDQVIKEIGGC